MNAATRAALRAHLDRFGRDGSPTEKGLFVVAWVKHPRRGVDIVCRSRRGVDIVCRSRRGGTTTIYGESWDADITRYVPLFPEVNT